MSADTEPEEGRRRPEGREKPYSASDLDRALDQLVCRAKGIQAQADYHRAHEDALTQARSQYDGARSAYGAARDAVQPAVEDLRKQRAEMVDRLTYMVDDYKTRLVGEAFSRVQRSLRECDPNEGCTFDDDCDFDKTVRDCQLLDTATVIADIERRISGAAAMFADLIAEPANLARRMEDLKTEVADITTKMASDLGTDDVAALYADALIAGDHLETIWRGFENVNAYMDCLSWTLICQSKGYAAVSELKGRQAVRQCHQDQKAVACQRVRDHTRDEVIAEYIGLSSREAAITEEVQQIDADPNDKHEDRGNDRYPNRGRDNDL